jgi:hypothetical protein
MGGTAGGGDDDLEPARFGGFLILDRQFRSAVCGYNPRFVSDSEAVERVARFFHQRPVRIGPHHYANRYICHIFTRNCVFNFRHRRFSKILSFPPTGCQSAVMQSNHT